MKTGLFIRKYNGGIYAVEFVNKSIGMTVFVSKDKKEAEKELSRLKSLDKKQFIKEDIYNVEGNQKIRKF